MMDYGDETLCASTYGPASRILACQSSSNSKCPGGNVDIWPKSDLATLPHAAAERIWPRPPWAPPAGRVGLNARSA